MTIDMRPTLASMVGGPVEVWYDRRQKGLMVKDALEHAVRSLNSVCLSDVRFHADRNGRGALRRYVTGILLSDPDSDDSIEIRQSILRKAGGFLDFHWRTGTSWPLTTAERAVIGMPKGGFQTSAAHA